MNIRKLVLVGILIIVGGIGAYMYFYSQEEKVSPAVIAPKAPLPVVTPVKPQSVVAPASAPVAAPPASSSRVAAPVAPPSPASSIVATPVQTLQSPLTLSNSIKATKAKPERSKTADLRYCLALESNAAIAKCAGE